MTDKARQHFSYLQVVLKQVGKSAEIPFETEVFNEIVNHISRIRDPYVKREIALDFEECLENEMKPSYYRKERLRRRKSEIRESYKIYSEFAKPLTLCIELEKIASAYQSDRGDRMATGVELSSKRYPVHINGKRLKKIPPDIFEVDFLSAHYRFGVHSFSVWSAITEMLATLEKRYGLNFRELEEAYLRSNPGDNS